MGDPVVTFIIDAKNLASAQVKGLQKDMRGLDDAGQKSNAMMERGGMVAKGVLAMGIAAAGFAAVRYGADSVAAFREEEVGIARLGAALKANVKDWDGNTAAIEDSIRARMNLSGFDDGALRQSLGSLVAATHNVNKAFDLQATAMDLARFKGISLEDASTALIKVEGGQYRALKELGIVLEKGASQTEALAAVQKVAGGQMAAYMETGAGKAELLDAKLGNLQETLGERLTPALITATDAAISLVDVLSGEKSITNDNFVGEAYKAQNAIEGIGDALSDALDFLTPWDQFMGASAERQAAALKAAADAAKSSDTFAELRAGLRELTPIIEQERPKWHSGMLGNMDAMEKAVRDGRQGVLSAFREMLTERYREADAADQIIVNRAEIAAQKRIIADKKTTAAQKAEARIRLRALRADNAALEAEMELLKNKGYTYGRGFTLGFVRGLVKDTDRVGESARVLARTVKKYLQVHSPSEEGPFSEMGGPDGWGSRFGTLWAGGLARTAGAAAGAAGGFAGAVAMPGGGGIGVAGPPMGMGGGGGGVTLVVNSTYPPSPQQVREMADILDAEMTRRRPRFSPYGR